jgi:hypothetical protein
MELFFAILIGLFFGFVLQKSGAANPQRILGMLRLKDFHLMKTIFLGIGLSSLLLFLLMALGGINTSHLSVKTAYFGVILGGGIMGMGWALSGFCPGTGIVAAGALRKDALFFILGGLVGAWIFIGIYGSLASTALFEKIGGGKATLAETGMAKYTALLPALPALAVAGSIAIIFILIAWKLPQGNRDQ